VDGLKPNSYTDAQKITWINEVEQVIKEEIMRTFVKSTIARVSGTTDYALPDGVAFEDIEDVYINSIWIPQLDARSYLDTYKGDNGYYKPDAENSIAFSPTPIVTDDENYPGIQISYLDRFAEYTDEELDLDLMITQSRYQKVYTFYIMAQIDLFNKEYENYNNMMAQYNAAITDYRTWYESRSAKEFSETVSTIYTIEG
jgi:hypothetical protein